MCVCVCVGVGAWVRGCVGAWARGRVRAHSGVVSSHHGPNKNIITMFSR